MSRHAAATDAAINGLVGFVLLSIGSIVASALGTIFDPVIATILATIVRIVCAFYGLKQFVW